MPNCILFRVFEETVSYFGKYLTTSNLTFILGFFVTTVSSRWMFVLRNMGYIESNALFVSSYLSGEDEDGRLMRRAIVRYLCLSQVMVYRDISISIRKRFPTMKSLIAAGYILEHEKNKLEKYDLKYDKYWVPINWAASIIFTARRSGRITADILVNKLMDEIKAFRSNLQMLCIYDWVPLPLVYPQIDLILPLMTMLQFIFFVGWMKVAMALLNPFGEDDDDFECKFLLSKNLATSLMIVDKCSGKAPEVKEDKFYESGVVEPLYPETNITEDRPLIGSAAMTE
uniref:Bestrophin homolog n=1 Tax=Syphacia muris TaxID=451379 RepID=A0A158R640_9BILA